MQYIKFRGTLRPAARHAANDAEKLIAIISPSSLPKNKKYKHHYRNLKSIPNDIKNNGITIILIKQSNLYT